MAGIRLRVALVEALGASVTALLVVAFGVLQLDFWHLRHPVLFGGDVGIMLEYIRNGLQNGGVDIDPQLGWPFHSGLAAFPVLDNLSAGVVRMISLVTHDPATGDNILIYIDHVLSGVVGYLCFRALRIPGISAVACGVAFAWVEFSLEPSRVVAHISLQLIAPLAIGATIALLPATRPISVKQPLVRICILVAAVVIGLAQPYWVAFSFLVMGIGILAYVLEGRCRSAALLAATVSAMLIVAALCLVWPRLHGEPAIPIDRSPYQQPVYGLRLINLLLPPRSVIFPGVNRFYESFLGNSGAIATEGFDAFLGWGGLVGLVLGAVLLLRATLRRGSGAVDRAPELAFAILLTVLIFAEPFGLGEVFNLFVTPEIRAQNRASPLVAFLALFIFAAIADRFVASGRCPRAVAGALVSAVVAIGLWDQSAGISYAALQSDPATVVRWNSVKAAARTLTDVLPAGTRIAQLPLMFFPENPSIGSLDSYDQMQVGLFTSGMHYSFGATRSEPSYIDPSSPIAAAVTAAAIGYDEMLLYKAGYPTGVETAIAEMQKSLPVEGNLETDSFVGLDLKQLRDGVESLDPAVLRVSIGWEGHGFSTVEGSPGAALRWDNSPEGKAEITIDNASPTPVSMRFCGMIVAAVPGYYRATIDASGEITRPTVGPSGLKMDLTFEAPPGRSAFSIAVPAPRLQIPTDLRKLHFQTRNPVLQPAAILTRATEIANRFGVAAPDPCR